MTRFTIITAVILAFAGCVPSSKLSDELTEITTTPDQGNQKLEFVFREGEAFNHPSVAVWTEDMDGEYLETLYVTDFVAKGRFGKGELGPGKWTDIPGEVRRPASLPYWAHKRNIKAPDGLFIPSPETAVPDAISGATPKAGFKLHTSCNMARERKFRILVEVNQAWDSNAFWTNDKYPGDLNYFGSLQPALIYAVTIDPLSDEREYVLNPVGHSHPTGASGKLFTDISTLTTAKEIYSKITVTLK